METKFLCAKTKAVVYENTFTVSTDNKNDINEKEYRISADSHSIYLNETWFNETFVSYLKLSFGREVDDYRYRIAPRAGVLFLFCLEGFVKIKAGIKKNIIYLVEGEQCISAFHQQEMELSFSERAECVILQFTTEHYKYLTGIDFSDEVSVYDSDKIKPEIRMILNNLINQKNEERIKRIFFESKLYELLVFFINAANEKPRSILKQHDMEKILYARTLVENNLQFPLSLMELSRAAGINDYKLKIGFKELTGNTVFGYLYKIRMQKAHHHLSVERKTVNEVSFLVGYKNAQHFTVAFKKMYGILPGRLNRGQLSVYGIIIFLKAFPFEKLNFLS